MAPYSSTLAWKIPWMEEPGRQQSMGSLSRTQLKRLSSSSSGNLQADLFLPRACEQVPSTTALSRCILGYLRQPRAFHGEPLLNQWRHLGFPGGLDGREYPFNSGEPGWIPGLGRSSGEGKSYPLQYSCPENSIDRGAWWATVHGVTKSWAQLSDFHFSRTVTLI